MRLGRYGFRFKALGGSNELQLYATEEKEAVCLARELLSVVYEIERKFSRYREDSVVAEINRAAGGEPVQVDDETAYLLHFADLAHKKSGGLFDITSGVLRRVWDFKSEVVPSAEDIEPLLKLIGWDKVEWRAPYISLPKAGMQIDLGGIGKEYAADRLAEHCLERGLTHGLINLGGDIRALGPHPDGTPWRIGITDPRERNRSIAYVELEAGALATSGDYEKFFEKDGKRYFHILSPKDGFPPVGSYRSASVVAESCLRAGSLTTMAILSGEPLGESLIQEENVSYLLISEDGQLKAKLGESVFRKFKDRELGSEKGFGQLGF